MKRPVSRRLFSPFWWLVLVMALPVPAQAQTEATPAQLEALKRQISQIDQWLRQAEKDRSSLERELVDTEQAINRLIRERRELQTQRAAQAQQLAELKAQENQLTASLDRQRESLRQQIRQAWMAGDTPALKVLLNEVDPQRVARTMTYYEYLSKDAVARLDAFNATLDQLQQTRQQTLATQGRLNRLEQEVADRQSQLQQRRQQRQQTLAALEAKIDDRQSERATLSADRARLEKLLREVEEAIASIPSPNESKPFKALRAKLPWPARGKVTRGFGDSLAQGKLRHNGLLISTSDESEVRAVHYGRVVFANWLRGFGLMTIIDHGDGYMSLYGNNSSLLASPGDWVAAGETIALAGQSGGGDDTGVYFEIRHRGKPQNPQVWLARQ
ncbi:MAG: peptidoglycan DD-metalloendopeptidase family protein [Marinobacter sp.]|uniref:murein hydrolase activator EnvC family protein n=1 Tax=Marinobacter sp. TaxID=50741 RepID=UPI00299DC0C2|nr:peptidoglycan DD-metalloendopeptidase family protein [Marinobacter sp.]MDX1633990.1 peptidoglycan DD-metalloendopeptidase family protein [Marinobacter sp.]